MIERIVEECIRPVHAALPPVDLTLQRRRHAVRRRLARARQRQHHRFYSHGSAPFVSRIIEK